MILSRLKQYRRALRSVPWPQWLPQISLPKGLYARAALIMVLPIITLQLLVSVVFIKRDLEDITRQMTGTMVRELALVNQTIGSSSSQAQAIERIASELAPLRLQIRFLAPDEAIPEDVLHWTEFSGYEVRRTLALGFGPFRSLQLHNNRQALVVFESALGLVEVNINRRRFTPAAPHQMIVTMAVFGLFLTIISFLYMRNQLRPIKRLAMAAEGFGRGRMVAYVPRGATEVRAAGAAFIDMRARIERQIEQRTLMLSGVSHDLRTPLTRLKLALSMTDSDDADDMLRDVRDMEALVDAFLDFSRGVTTSAMEKCDPEQLVEDAVSRWKKQGKDVNLIEVSGNRSVPLRQTAVQRAVDNLISNAVRHGTRARVSLTLTERSMRIRVEDDGPGIAAEARGDAMRPFVRLDPSRNQDKGSGVGLGLAIVADIARAHGGTLRLGKSEDLGGLQADIVIAL